VHEVEVAAEAQAMGTGQQDSDGEAMPTAPPPTRKDASTAGGAHAGPKAAGLLALACGAFQGSFHRRNVSSVSYYT
jgi:hypothetical protein